MRGQCILFCENIFIDEEKGEGIEEKKEEENEKVKIEEIEKKDEFV